MKHLYHPRSNGRYEHDLNPADAQWKYLSFSVVMLSAGQGLAENTQRQEVVIVPLTGHAEVTFNGTSCRIGRQDVFRELTDIVYLPPRTDFVITTDGSLEVALGRAPAEGRLPPRLIRRETMEAFIRGGTNAKRGVSVLLDSDELSERLTVYEIHTPSGNWSSFPGHRHDTRDQSSYHEETYYYRLSPEDGFGMQRLYAPGTELDVAVPVAHRDVVLIHEGYHPFVTAPGTNAYYLNFLAGDVRRISAVNDPRSDWVREQWEGNPLVIPVRG